MSGTIPIEADNFDEEYAFDNATVAWFGQSLDQFRVLPSVFNTGMADDFEPRALG